jgi:hypothetical protein
MQAGKMKERARNKRRMMFSKERVERRCRLTQNSLRVNVKTPTGVWVLLYLLSPNASYAIFPPS